MRSPLFSPLYYRLPGCETVFKPELDIPIKKPLVITGVENNEPGKEQSGNVKHLIEPITGGFPYFCVNSTGAEIHKGSVYGDSQFL